MGLLIHCTIFTRPKFLVAVSTRMRYDMVPVCYFIGRLSRLCLLYYCWWCPFSCASCDWSCLRISFPSSYPVAVCLLLLVHGIITKPKCCMLLVFVAAANRMRYVMVPECCFVLACCCCCSCIVGVVCCCSCCSSSCAS